MATDFLPRWCPRACNCHIRLGQANWFSGYPSIAHARTHAGGGGGGAGAGGPPASCRAPRRVVRVVTSVWPRSAHVQRAETACTQRTQGARTQARGSGSGMGVVDLRVAHGTAGGAREADARRGRVGWSGTARRAALHMRESTHPTAMYVRSLALAALALAGSLALGAANEPAGRAACRTRHCAVGRWGVPSRRAAGPRVDWPSSSLLPPPPLQLPLLPNLISSLA